MSLLVFDVLYDPIQLRNTHTEGSICGLPREPTLVGETVMHPFRGAAFDQLHGFGYRHGRRQRQQQVNMVFHAANTQGFHLVFAGDATQKWPESVPKLRRQAGPPIFCAEHTVRIRTDV